MSEERPEDGLEASHVYFQTMISGRRKKAVQWSTRHMQLEDWSGLSKGGSRMNERGNWCVGRGGGDGYRSSDRGCIDD